MGASAAALWRRRHGRAAAATLVAVSIALSLGHAGSIVSLGYLPAAVAISVWLLWTDRHLELLEFTIWLWLLDPEVRRFADYGSHYHSSSLIIVTASVVSLICGTQSLWRSTTVVRVVRNTVAVAVCVIVYAFLVALVRGRTTAAAADLLFYSGPIGLGVFVLSMRAGRDAVLARLSEIAVLALVVLGAYGIVQFLVAPVWDVDWIVQSGITAVGQPTPFNIRVFSTLDTAGPFAQTVVVLVLLALMPPGRSRLRPVGLALGLVALGLSLIRAAWIGLLVVTIMLTLARRLRAGRLLVSIAAVVIVVGFAGGPVRSAIVNRVDNTVSAGGSDTSLQARASFQTQIAPKALRDFGGEGLGSTGVATHLASGSDPSLVSSFDSGVFEIMYTAGSIPGAVLLISLVGCAAYLWRRARAQPPPFAFVTAGAISLLVSLIFTDTLKGVYGAMLWLMLGVAGRMPIRAAVPQPEPSTAPRLEDLATLV